MALKVKFKELWRDKHLLQPTFYPIFGQYIFDTIEQNSPRSDLSLITYLYLVEWVFEKKTILGLSTGGKFV